MNLSSSILLLLIEDPIAKIIMIMHIVKPRMEGNSEAMSTKSVRTKPRNTKILESVVARQAIQKH